MITTIRPRRIELYINTAEKTLAQIKAETGASHIINGGLYDLKTRVPYCQLKAGGKVYTTDTDNYWGFAWDDVSDFGMCRVPCSKANYIACVDLLRGGNNGDMIVTKNIDGSRQRTAIGRKADGSIVLYCTQSGRKPEEVREEMRNAGCVDALMLDGGLSSQCDFDGWILKADRKCHNYICIWAEGEDMALRIGNKGAEVKELQSKLNKLGYGLTVDGDFGMKTHSAVLHFQNYWGLAADGVVGSATQTRIDKAISFAQSSNPL
ncbi:MAG: peptidoglycan-binding protein, partial [Ruminococcus sp.]|nr:peptidoglycan-binding protein [Ruminococcus sp.]